MATLDNSVEARLHRLEAQAEIVRLKSRYFNAGDLMDFDAMRDCFTSDALIDFPSAGIKGGPDDFCRLFSEHAAANPAVNVHHGHNPEIEILSDRHARGVWNLYFFALMDEGRTCVQSSGLYYDEYRLTDAGWRISSCRTDIRLALSANIQNIVQINFPVASAGSAE